MGKPVIPTWVLERIALQHWHRYGTVSVKALRRAVNGCASTERIARVVRWVKAAPPERTMPFDAEPRWGQPELPARQHGRRSPSTARRCSAAGQRASVNDPVVARLRLLQDRPRTRRERTTVRDDRLPITLRDERRTPEPRTPQIPVTDERAMPAAVLPTPPTVAVATDVATNDMVASVPNAPMIGTVTIPPQDPLRPLEATPLATLLRLVTTELVRRVLVLFTRSLSGVMRLVRRNARQSHEIDAVTSQPTSTLNHDS